MEIYPRNWLTLARASIEASALYYRVPRLAGGYDGTSAILNCRRYGAARVDCRMTENRRRCDGVISILLRGRSLRWGEYACPSRRDPRWRKRPRRLRSREISCDVSDAWCARHPLARPFGWRLDRAILYPGL